jgi:hypothetical protein
MEYFVEVKILKLGQAAIKIDIPSDNDSICLVPPLEYNP